MRKVWRKEGVEGWEGVEGGASSHNTATTVDDTYGYNLCITFCLNTPACKSLQMRTLGVNYPIAAFFCLTEEEGLK